MFVTVKAVLTENTRSFVVHCPSTSDSVGSVRNGLTEVLAIVGGYTDGVGGGFGEAQI